VEEVGKSEGRPIMGADRATSKDRDLLVEIPNPKELVLSEAKQCRLPTGPSARESLTTYPASLLPGALPQRRLRLFQRVLLAKEF
jgi:hypothetical protein